MPLSLERVVVEWEARPRGPLRCASFSLAEVGLGIATDDPELLNEVATVLGPSRAETGAERNLRFGAEVRAQDAPSGFGHLRLDVSADELLTPADFVLGTQSPDFPFYLLDATPPWTQVAFHGEVEPIFALRGRDCLFRLVPQWRTAVALFLFQRLMRMRGDALFFHASSVVLEGRGVMLVGRKGAGKSTLALGLAARGHALLGDENACFLPASASLLPFLRPLGIKPGPRSRRVQEALQRLGRDPDREGPMRVPVEALFPGNRARAAPLGAVVFLDPFAERPGLRRIEPGRTELAGLQPAGSSLVNASPSRRVFEMARLLAQGQVWRLEPGDPDETADRLERAFDQ